MPTNPCFYADETVPFSGIPSGSRDETLVEMYPVFGYSVREMLETRTRCNSRYSALDAADLAGVMVQLALAAQSLHEHNLVHTNIWAGNALCRDLNQSFSGESS